MSDRSRFAPPAAVNFEERGILGVDYRKIVIFAVTIPIAAAVIFLWKDVPLYISGAVGILIAGMGFALAFGQIDGKTPELWLRDFLFFARRDKFLVHRGLRERPDTRQVKFGEDAAVAAKPVATTQTKEWDFFVITANVMGLAAIAGLTIWLAQGGGHELLRWWGSLSNPMPL